MPRFSWTFDLPSTSVQRGSFQTAYQIQVSLYSNLTTGPFVWDSGRVSSNDTYLVPYAGLGLSSDTMYYWHVCAWDALGNGPTSFSAAASFRTGLLSPSDWHGGWITGTNESNLIRVNFSLPPGRRAITATAYLIGVGYAELSCNGQSVSPTRRLESAWTSYRHRVRYMSLDIMGCLGGLSGGDEVVLGLQLGNGWFACRGWYAQPPYPYPSGEHYFFSRDFSKYHNPQ